MTLSKKSEERLTPRVAICLYEGSEKLECEIAAKMLHGLRLHFSAWFSTRVVRFSKTTPNSCSVQVPESRDTSLAGFDIIVIPGYESRYDPPPTLITELKKVKPRQQRLILLGRGSLLAVYNGIVREQVISVGLIESLELQHQLSNINIRISPTFSYGDTILSSAGSLSSVKLLLDLVKRYFGVDTQRESKRLLLHDHGADPNATCRLSICDRHRRFEEALEWALMNLHEHPKIEDLAEHAYVSRDTMIRYFKRFSTITPAEWLKLAQLSRAVILMRETSRTLNEILIECNVNSSKTFNIRFKRFFNMPPSDYRKAHISTCLETRGRQEAIS